MSKRFPICVAVLLALTAAVWFSFHPWRREPQYRGMTVTAWIEEMRVGGSQIEVTTEAFLAMGGQSVPYLIREVKRRPAPFHKWLASVHGKLPDFVRILLPQPEVGDAGRAGAAHALQRLGALAVPGLIGALRSPDADVRLVCVRTLANIEPKSPELVRALIERLKDDSPMVRHSAADGLGRNREPHLEAIMPLVHALADADVSVRSRVAASLGALGAASLPFLNEALKSTNALTREGALVAISRMAPRESQAVDALILQMSDPDPKIRKSAVDLIGDLRGSPLRRPPPTPDQRPAPLIPGATAAQGQSAQAGLIRSLSDPDTLVRRAATIAVMKLGLRSEELARAFVGLLGDRDADNRKFAAMDLGEFAEGRSEVVAALMRALRDGDADVRMLALGSLSRARPMPAEVVRAFVEFLADPEPRARSAAASGLIQAGPAGREAIPRLLEALGTPPTPQVAAPSRPSATAVGQIAVVDVALVPVVAEALGAIGAEPETVVPALVERLRARHINEWPALIKAIGQFGGNAQSAVPDLIDALRQPDAATVAAAVGALGRTATGSDEVVGSLAQALSSPESMVRFGAAEALRGVGPRAVAAVPALTLALEDPERMVRRGAALALVAFNPNAKAEIPNLAEALRGMDEAGGAERWIRSQDGPPPLRPVK